MEFRQLYQDPHIEEESFFPDSMSVSIKSHESDMFGVLYTAMGQGPHPTMLLLHGFPGTEKNLDLAHAFRRAGWNTLVFHYRGSWGSEGDFSFEHVLEDVQAALEFVCSDEACVRYRIDRDKIVLLGHSMGGFASMLTAAGDERIKACIALAPFDFGLIAQMAKENPGVKHRLIEVLRECIIPLKGTSVDLLLEEMTAHAGQWNFVHHASALSRRKLLLIAGGRDDVALPPFHYQPLVDAMKEQNAGCFSCHLLDSDHSFQDKRILLSEIIQQWLEQEL